MAPLSGDRIDLEVARVLRERVARLRTGLEALTEELLEPIPLPGPGLHQAPSTPSAAAPSGIPAFLTEAVRGLAGAADQIALLDRLLEGAARCFSRICLFVVRGDTAHGWSSVGLPETEEGDPAKGLAISLTDQPVLRATIETRRPVRQDPLRHDVDFLPALRPGDRVPRRSLAVPLVIQDEVAAILYADDGGDGRAECDFASAEILANVTALGANLLALQSHPLLDQRDEAEAAAEMEVRVPSGEEGGGLVAGPAFLEADDLEDELFAEPGLAPPSETRGVLTPEEERLHGDARRFARLLVSELLLYNEDMVIQGRRHRDIYSRLKDDIDRSRQTYDQRVPRSVSDRSDYFTQELVRTLAGGDPAALGEMRNR